MIDHENCSGGYKCRIRKPSIRIVHISTNPTVRDICNDSRGTGVMVLDHKSQVEVVRLIMNQVTKNARISAGTVHKMPADLRKALASNPKVLDLWDDITPLARNEWICWVTSGKKSETRNIRIGKALSKLNSGMRRPCCWPGCPHR